MTYKVINNFKDKSDNLKFYRKGDSYFHEDESRISFLIEKGFIEKVEQVEETKVETKVKHAGGGYYELPNGERVRGKDKAIQALKDLERSE